MRNFLFYFFVTFVTFSVAALFMSGLARAGYFEDVQIDHPHYTAIGYVKESGLMNGYEDGSFRPGVTLNRAELMKVAAGGLPVGMWEEGGGESCFSDVPADAWYREAVCKAKATGIVSGYEDGTFRPGQRVTVAEAAKIMSLSHGLEAQGEGEYWFTPYLNIMDGKRVLPPSFLYFNQGVTRGELAEMMWRLSLDSGGIGSEAGADSLGFMSHADLATADIEALGASSCTFSPENVPRTINMQRVRQTWLDWTNEARAAGGLHAYTYSDQLGRTAAVWSERAKSLGYMNHTRPGSSAYYDYGLIGRWFADLGVTFASGPGRSDYVENIGWEYYSCTDGECTDELIAGIRKTFNFFMSEKGWAYAPHYDSIMNPHYQLLGFGLAVDESRRKFYLTVHYGTDITSNPAPVCPA